MHIVSLSLIHGRRYNFVASSNILNLHGLPTIALLVFDYIDEYGSQLL